MRLATDLRKLRACSGRERWMLLEAMVWLSLGRAAVRWLSFRRASRLLGLRQHPVAPDPNSVQQEVAACIGWAVRMVAARAPGKSACLVQTLAAAAMMRLRGIPFALSLGVAKDSAAKNSYDLIAHAWLSCGRVIATGAGGRERFTPISVFVARPEKAC
jgi:hypothetical protein